MCETVDMETPLNTLGQKLDAIAADSEGSAAIREQIKGAKAELEKLREGATDLSAAASYYENYADSPLQAARALSECLRGMGDLEAGQVLDAIRAGCDSDMRMLLAGRVL